MGPRLGQERVRVEIEDEVLQYILRVRFEPGPGGWGSEWGVEAALRSGLGPGLGLGRDRVEVRARVTVTDTGMVWICHEQL